jgi:polyisoprenoid-binding protein YceI
VPPHDAYHLGPDNATLSLRTGRTGAAAKAGHDLLIDVTAWSATLVLAKDPAHTTATLDADPTSLRVREGTGGMQTLAEDDKTSIATTIDQEILKRAAIAFRSTTAAAAADPRQITITGELTLAGHTHPLAFELLIGADGTLNAHTALRQTDWGIKPYSTLFGALKVTDNIEITLTTTPP